MNPRSNRELWTKNWRLFAIGIMALILLGIVMSLPGCGLCRDDCMAEEMLEECIDYETGMDLDLSPGSPEQGCIR